MYDVSASFNARMIVDAIRASIAENADNSVDIDNIASKFSSVPKNESLVMELHKIVSKERSNDVYLSKMIVKYADTIKLDPTEPEINLEACFNSRPIEFGQGQNSDLDSKLNPKQDSELESDLDPELRAMIEKIERLEAAKKSEERYKKMVSEGEIDPDAGLTPKPKL